MDQRIDAVIQTLLENLRKVIVSSPFLWSVAFFQAETSSVIFRTSGKVGNGVCRLKLERNLSN